MPKEIVHWTIAELSYRKLKDGFLKSEIENHHSEFLIGAIAFDIPYYDFSKKMTDIGCKLHGKDKKNAETHYDKLLGMTEKPEGFWAFIAGTICHAITDINYHPFVFHYTLDVVEKHRELETNLDLFYLERVFFPHYSLSKLIKSIKMDRNVFYKILSTFIFGDEKQIKKVKINLIKYKIIQYMIRKKFFYTLLELLKLNNIKSLCYGEFKKKDFPLFESSLEHPSKDGIKKISLEEIEKKTISDILSYFKLIEQKKDLIITFPPLSGLK